MKRKKKKGYWYKKYVEEKFSSIYRIEKIKENSLKLQAKEYKRRLDDLNGEAGRLRAMQSTYIPREVYENSLKSVLDKTEAAAGSLAEKQQELVDKTIVPMREWQNKLQGNIAVIVIVGGAIWAIIMWLLNKIPLHL